MSRRNSGRTDRGLLWMLPELKSKDFGKLGPGFGFGIGCGAGVGIGFFGGVGIGLGLGPQFGFGMGAGCGVGIGFGYGAGKGIAYDEYRRYTNVGKKFHRAPRSSSSQNEIDELVTEVLDNTRRLLKAASREIDKWRWN